jgi:hypothetical protein
MELQDLLIDRFMEHREGWSSARFLGGTQVRT